MKKLNIVIITAHPDDIETSMGGTLARLVDAGHNVKSVVITAGNDEKQQALRQKESIDAHQIVGLTPVMLNLYEDDFAADMQSEIGFRNIIMSASPDVVFAHYALDVHPHHRMAGILTMGPCLTAGNNVEIICFEVASNSHPQSLHFVPTHYANISDAMEMKNKMIRCHASQDGEALVKTHEKLSANRGEECGFKHAEAYIRLTRTALLLPELQGILTPTPWHLPRRIGTESLG